MPIYQGVRSSDAASATPSGGSRRARPRHGCCSAPPACCSRCWRPTTSSASRLGACGAMPAMMRAMMPAMRAMRAMRACIPAAAAAPPPGHKLLVSAAFLIVVELGRWWSYISRYGGGAQRQPCGDRRGARALVRCARGDFAVPSSPKGSRPANSPCKCSIFLRNVRPAVRLGPSAGDVPEAPGCPETAQKR
jgi:hypothetical protein